MLLLTWGSGSAFGQIAGSLNVPMIDSVLSNNPSDDPVEQQPENGAGEPAEGSVGKVSPQQSSGPSDASSQPNASAPDQPSSQPRPTQGTPSEPNRQDPNSAGASRSEKPMQPESSQVPVQADDSQKPKDAGDTRLMDPKNVAPHGSGTAMPVEDADPATSSLMLPGGMNLDAAPTSDQPPPVPRPSDREAMPDNRQLPVDVPSSSLNLMPLEQTPPVGESLPSGSPIPSNLMVDPTIPVDAAPQADPLIGGPAPPIPMLLPESQAPIKSDLFPLSGGGTDTRQEDAWKLLGGRFGLPGGYLGLRLGGTLVAPLDKKLTKIGTYGLLLEVRQGSWAGLRLAYDVVPDFRADVVDQAGTVGLQTVVSWRKMQIGWALTYNTKRIFDAYHISPSVGIYGVRAQAPLTTDIDGVPEQRSFSVDRVINFGLEVDAEKVLFKDSILRFWASRFLTLGATDALAKSTVKDARMTRAGIDFYLRGPKVSRAFSLSYLAFVSYDSMELLTNAPELLNPLVNIQMPFLGFGSSLSW